MIHLICPDGFLGLTSPQQTSKEFSLSKVVGSSLVSVKGLSEMRVMAAPPPRLEDLGGRNIPDTMYLKGFLYFVCMGRIGFVLPNLTM